FLYKAPAENSRVNAAELAYIEQDNESDAETPRQEAAKQEEEKSIPFLQCFRYPQTWAVFFGKFLTDGVWWFFLFWTPAYITDVFNLSTSSGEGMLMIFVLYLITMLSIYGGKLPTIFIDKAASRGVKVDPYSARMKAMFIFALFPLLALLAQPLSSVSQWMPIIIIGIAGAAHQSWSANIYSVVGDMFPKSTIATIIGIGGMAGGIGSFLINLCSGILFDYAAQTNMAFMSYEGKPAGYFIVFCICGVAYLVGWCIMKLLVPRYKVIEYNPAD
ncbi:MAG: MFS transporter, partial [Duncaniella sp.]|nr:MFS transporter [Duncaniella sp.]